MSNPKVSVIIPFFNSEDFLEETLSSIATQTYANWECILVDDGSTDSSSEIIRSFTKSDERFKLFERDREPKGAPTCRNIGFQKSQGELINWFDADDLMHPEMLARKVEQLSSNPAWDFVVSRCSAFNESNSSELMDLDYKLTSETPVEDYISFAMRFYTPGPMIRRSFLKTFDEMFDEDLIRHQEGEFYFRLLHFSKEYGVIEKPLAFIRKHEASLGVNYSKGDDKLRFQNDLRFDSKLLIFALNNNMISDESIESFQQVALRYLRRSCKTGWGQMMTGLELYSRVIAKRAPLSKRIIEYALIPVRVVKYALF